MIVIDTCPKCGHDLVDISIYTYPPIHRRECPNCGWSFEHLPQQMIKIPFHSDYKRLTMERIFSQGESVCENCGCNPKNGGSGICNCILGQTTIY